VEARVIALCDSFDALTHTRPWRTAFTVQAALQMVRKDAGKRFDPSLSERFIAWLEEERLKVGDLDSHFGAEALENDYVRTNMRIDRLVRSAATG
jgi:putative two-component system response regulator